jgi:GH24 family phage-related lysozyme (muramidase)
MSGTVPSQAIKLIQDFEGCERLDQAAGLIHAYPDPRTKAEPWTIGWGTTVYPDGRPVGEFDTITREDADKFFVISLQKSYWDRIAERIPFWGEMNDPMRSALCSFAYNLGSNFYGAEDFNTISACLREKRWQDVPDALMLYVNPGSDVEAGLRRRRAAEGKLWEEGLANLPSGEEPAALQIIEAVSETFLKKEKRDSSELSPHELVPIETGRQWKIAQFLRKEGNSQQVRLAYGAGDWWIYAPHWTVRSQKAESAAGGVPEEAPVAPASSVGERDLKVPYLSQLNNRENPYGSCNVTCVAMCLKYLGMKDPEGMQLEDYLYRKMLDLGKSRHDPYHLKYLIETFPGYKDIFRENGSFADIKSSIDAGNPVIIHGYFTKFGHIIVVRGYDDKGFLVNDPYGEWFSSGYDNSRSGERLHYSYNLIARTCSPESAANPRHIWYHTVFKV